MVFSHRDLFGEIHVSVKKGSENIKLPLFIGKVWSVQLDFEKNVLLPIEQILLTSVWQGLFSLFRFWEYNLARPVIYLESHHMLECVNISWTFELNQRLLYRIRAIQQYLPLNFCNLKLLSNCRTDNWKDNKANKNDFFTKYHWL